MSENLESLSQEREDYLVDAIPKALIGAKPKAPVYCIMINFYSQLRECPPNLYVADTVLREHYKSQGQNIWRFPRSYCRTAG